MSSDVLIDSNTMSDIADAIRAKSGVSTSFFPADMPSAISSISGGGIPAFGRYEEVLANPTLEENTLFLVDHSNQKFTGETQSNFISFPEYVRFETVEYNQMLDDMAQSGMPEISVTLGVENYSSVDTPSIYTDFSNATITFNQDNVFLIDITINALYYPNGRVIDLHTVYSIVEANQDYVYFRRGDITGATGKVDYPHPPGVLNLPTLYYTQSQVSYNGELQDNIYYVPGLTLGWFQDDYNFLRFLNDNIKFYSDNYVKKIFDFWGYYEYDIGKTTLPPADYCILNDSISTTPTGNYTKISNSLYDSSSATTISLQQTALLPFMQSLSLDFSSTTSDSNSENLGNSLFSGLKTVYFYNLSNLSGVGNFTYFNAFNANSNVETVIISDLSGSYRMQLQNKLADFSNISNKIKTFYIVGSLPPDFLYSNISNAKLVSASNLSNESLNRYMWLLGLQQQTGSISAIFPNISFGSGVGQRFVPNYQYLLDKGWSA